MASMAVVELDGAGWSASAAHAEPIQAFPTIPPADFSTTFPTFPTILSTDFPTRSLIPSRTVPPINRGLPSRLVNQMASHIPVPFPPRGKRRGTFSQSVRWKHPKKSACDGETVPSRTTRVLAININIDQRSWASMTDVYRSSPPTHTSRTYGTNMLAQVCKRLLYYRLVSHRDRCRYAVHRYQHLP